jgi:LysR family hydrogen peroxide-inducible transcriptional activator
MKLAPHPFTLRQLQYAVAVADVLSFRRAAEHCHVSQPSLSAQLATLESVLGVRLFERDRRRVIVTDAGRALVERARKVLLDADDLLEQSERARDPFSGILRVGVIPTVAPYLLPRATPRLRARLARLTIAWREDKTLALMPALAAGELDAALVARESELGDVELEVIGRDPFMLAVPPTHPLASSQRPVDAATLRDKEVLLLDEGHCFRDQALEVCSHEQLLDRSFRATSLATLMQMVAGGLGISLLPKLAMETEMRRARLRVRRIASPAAHRTVVLAFRKGAPCAQTGRVIADVLRQVFAELLRDAPTSRRSAKRK